MDAASAAAAPPPTPEQREPAVNWALLRRLAKSGTITTGVEARSFGQDQKPRKGPKCEGCGVKYPGARVCGYCRGRIAELRRAAGGVA